MINFESVEEILFSKFDNFEVQSIDGDILYKKGELIEKPNLVDIYYEKKRVGEILHSGEDYGMQELARYLAPLLIHLPRVEIIANAISVLKWLKEVQATAPKVVDWIGVYYKSEYYFGENSTDLVLGPFIGESTDHVRISLDRGFCGMALREERTVNVEDVTKESTHIACSLSTRSELVIPIKNSDGEYVAELDLDSDTLAAFTPDLEKEFISLVASFPLL